MRIRWQAIQAAMILASLLYLGMIAEIAFGFPLDPARSYLSELAAQDQQSSMYFRIVDSISGALMASCAVALWVGLERSSRIRVRLARISVQVAIIALGLFGLGTILDVLFPMACAASADPTCASRTLAGEFEPQTTLHEGASVLADGAAVVLALSLLVLCWVGRANSSGIARIVDIFTAITATIAAASSAVVSVMALASPDGDLIFGTGYVQRLQTLSFCILLIILIPRLRRVGALVADTDQDNIGELSAADTQ